MKNITVKIPDRLLDLVDTLVEEGLFSSRSSVVRTALNVFLIVLLNTSKVNQDLRQKIVDKFLGRFSEVVMANA